LIVSCLNMQETRLRSDAEIWLRYLKAGLPRNVLDVTAMHRLAHMVSSNPVYGELFASMFAESLRTNSETEAVLMLHAINTVVYNLRIWTKTDSSDADFLAQLLNACGGVMTDLASNSWPEWSLNLGLTLMEWQLNYKIGNYLTPVLTQILSRSSQKLMNFRDLHYTLIEDIDSPMLQRLLQDRQAEQLCSNLLRVWEHSFYNPENIREPYTNVFCHYANSEGWQLLMKFTQKYVKSLENVNRSELFSSMENYLSHLPFAFVKSHFSTFLESAAGATVREILQMTQASDYNTVLKSQEYGDAVCAMVSILVYTFESLQSTAPFLGKFLFETCNYIKEVQSTYWKEISTLVITKNLAPAICNPLVSGITSAAENAGINLLSKTARIIQHACLGKSFEIKGFEWANQFIQRWQTELENGFNKTYNTRRSEPRNIALPRTLLIYDLNCLSAAVKRADIPISKCPGVSTTPILKVSSPTKVRHSSPFSIAAEEISEEIISEDEIMTKPTFSFGSNAAPSLKIPNRTNKSASFGLMSSEEFEDSTPSMQHLPLVQAGTPTSLREYAPDDIFSPKKLAEQRFQKTEIIRENSQSMPKRVLIERDDTSKEVEVDTLDTLRVNDGPGISNLELSKSIQTLEATRVGRKVQTEIAKTLRQCSQTDEVQTRAVQVQTDPDRQRFKIISRFENSIEVIDQETTTELDLDAIYTEKQMLLEQLRVLKEYHEKEQARTQTINDYWNSQFQDLKLENYELKNRNAELQEQLKLSREQISPQLEEGRFSHLDLRRELQERHYVADESILKKCDPHYYLQMENPWRRTEKRSFTRSTNEDFTRLTSSMKSINLDKL